MKTKLGKFEIEYTNKKEFHLIKEEIFGNMIYDFKSSKRNPYIIDVGSHIGLSIIFFKSIFPDAVILGFEPNPILFDVLERNIFNNNLKNVKIEKKAISTNENIVPFFVDPTDDMWFSNGSLNVGGWTGIEDSTPISVQSTSLLPYLDKEVDMLKIDVEGSEGYILNNISSQLHLVSNLCLEFHPGSNLNTITKILKNSGFKLQYILDGKTTLKPEPNKLMIIKCTR